MSFLTTHGKKIVLFGMIGSIGYAILGNPDMKVYTIPVKYIVSGFLAASAWFIHTQLETPGAAYQQSNQQPNPSSEEQLYENQKNLQLQIQTLRAEIGQLKQKTTTPQQPISIQPTNPLPKRLSLDDYKTL